MTSQKPMVLVRLDIDGQGTTYGTYGRFARLRPTRQCLGSSINGNPTFQKAP